MAVPGVSNALNLTVSLATRISVIIGDVLVLAVTWTKTAHAYREARRLNIRAPLATMLFRDGTIYFLILLVLNILQMIGENAPAILPIIFINPFSVTVPPMIVCHFILNLRQFEPAGSSWASADQSHSLRFVGNMGQSLQFGVEDADGEEEDVPGVEGTSAEDVEVHEEYVRRNYDTEQEPTYADV
ncbi:hypothetical protein BC629DRAFT_31621 [Irpex lacteus]|nr:hypothetical protein BC629DRAFT_31621 [Irpex lacteus]